MERKTWAAKTKKILARPFLNEPMFYGLMEFCRIRSLNSHRASKLFNNVFVRLWVKIGRDKIGEEYEVYVSLCFSAPTVPDFTQLTSNWKATLELDAIDVTLFIFKLYLYLWLGLILNCQDIVDILGEQVTQTSFLLGKNSSICPWFEEHSPLKVMVYQQNSEFLSFAGKIMTVWWVPCLPRNQENGVQSLSFSLSVSHVKSLKRWRRKISVLKNSLARDEWGPKGGVIKNEDYDPGMTRKSKRSADCFVCGVSVVLKKWDLIWCLFSKSYTTPKSATIAGNVIESGKEVQEPAEFWPDPLWESERERERERERKWEITVHPHIHINVYLSAKTSLGECQGKTFPGGFFTQQKFVLPVIQWIWEVFPR